MTCAALGSPCLRVQKTIAGVSTAAAVDGVVVRWRVLGAAPGSNRVRVVAPAGGTSYTVLRSSAPETVTATPSPTEAISTFATRLPIPAGGYVGLTPPLTAPRFLSSALGSEYGQLYNADDGMVASMSAPVNGELFYDADIEPDADHDGYGDVTQDGCPSDTATQGACPPPPPPPDPPQPTPTPVPQHQPAFSGSLGKAVYKARRGKKLRVTFTATQAGRYRLDLLKRKQRVKRVTGAVKVGANTITLRLNRKPGRYKLALTLTGQGGATATDSAKLRLKR